MSDTHSQTKIFELLNNHQQDILSDWMKKQLSANTLRSDLLNESELKEQSITFLKLFKDALASYDKSNNAELNNPAIYDFLNNMVHTRALQNFSASETATFIFSLKQPLFDRLYNELASKKVELASEIWTLTILIDKLGLYIAEQYHKVTKEIVKRQQQELLELSTPVVKLWEGIIMLPLIGTLDSERTQQIMENLLQHIVNSSSTVAIIDITGIPMVDTMVAQHLLKTINAARLMGADCIISGIRPQIAQTMVHLGVSLQDIITKATLADAVSLAMKQAGYIVSPISQTVRENHK